MAVKTVLVTGEIGFLGTHVVESLQSRVHVVPFSGDITDAGFVEDKIAKVSPDVVVHLAAISLPKQCDDNPILAKSVNVDGTKHVASALAKLGKPAHLIFTSTAQVYDYQVLSQGEPVDEYCKVTPQNFYADTKRTSEVYLKNMDRNQLSITVLRLFNHVHKSQVSATFMSSIFVQAEGLKRRGLSKGQVVVGNLELYRELNPVQSLIDLLARLALEIPNYKYEIFNVCSGETYLLSDVAQAFAEHYQLDIDYKTNLTLLRKDDPKVVVGSNEKIKRILNLSYPKLTPRELVKYFCSDL